MSKVDLDKFLIYNKGERTIYSKNFGFITVQCYKPKIKIQYQSKTIESNVHSYSSVEKEVSWEDIYVAEIQTTKTNGRITQKYKYTKFSFEMPLSRGAFLVFQASNKYHYRITNGYSGIRFITFTNPELILKYFNVRSNGSSNERGKYYDITPPQLKEILDNTDWEEDDKNQAVEVKNIKELQPKTKVFIDLPEGGEGEIVALKEFNALEQKAIFKVKLYNGNVLDINWFGEEETDSRGNKVVINNPIKAIVSKEYQPKNELDVLDETLLESALNPFVRGITNGFNVYWQTIETAAQYVVELYTWHEQSVGNKLYKLESRTIDRNCFYTAFTQLAEGKYFVRVVAEDRSGKRVAVNKAIAIEVKEAKATVVVKDRRGFVVG